MACLLWVFTATNLVTLNNIYLLSVSMSQTFGSSRGSHKAAVNVAAKLSSFWRSGPAPSSPGELARLLCSGPSHWETCFLLVISWKQPQVHLLRVVTVSTDSSQQGSENLSQSHLPGSNHVQRNHSCGHDVPSSELCSIMRRKSQMTPTLWERMKQEWLPGVALECVCRRDQESPSVWVDIQAEIWIIRKRRLVCIQQGTAQSSPALPGTRRALMSIPPALTQYSPSTDRYFRSPGRYSLSTGGYSPTAGSAGALGVSSWVQLIKRGGHQTEAALTWWWFKKANQNLSL